MLRQTFIHSFLCSSCFRAAGRDGCTAVGSPLLAGAPAQHRAMARPPCGLKFTSCKAVRVQTAKNNEMMTTGTERAHVIQAGDRDLYGCARASTPESKLHKFFKQRLITHCRGTGCPAWDQQVLTFPL